MTQTYRIRAQDEIQGPYSKVEVESRISSGIISASSMVSFNEGEWEELTKVFPPAGAQLTKADVVDPYLSSVSSTKESVGIGRLGFLGAAFAILLVGSLLLSAMDDSPIISFGTGLLMMLPASSRLKNIGRNPWWSLLLVIPLLGLFVTVPCFILPPGYQQHRKLDIWAKVVLGIFVVLTIVMFYFIFRRM